MVVYEPLTLKELYAEVCKIWSSLSSHGMLLLATALCGIFGLMISLGVIYTVFRVICWIFLGHPTGEHSECPVAVLGKNIWGPGPSSFGRQQRLSEITIEPIKNLGDGQDWGGAVRALGPNIEPRL